MFLEFDGRMIMEEEWCSPVSERWLCVGNKYFEHRSLHKYTMVARGQDGHRSGVGEEGYALCAECEVSERNGKRPLRSPCCTL